MSDWSPSTKETRDRMCPHCNSLAVAAIGHAVGDDGVIQSDYRCRDCSKDFVLLR